MPASETAPALYLIPIPVSPGALHTLSPEISTVTAVCSHYYVENLRTARRFLRELHPGIDIDAMTFVEMTKHEGTDLKMLESWQKAGHVVGIMSEAGCPGIADPGAELVDSAHRLGMTVRPLTGPSSLLLSLMASGLNGQSFAFNGYLPVKNPERGNQIKVWEQRSRKERQTQLFIETPYRNNALLQDLLRHLHPDTQLCIALGISSPQALIQTHKIAYWVQNTPVLPKEPAVFLFLAAS